MKLAVCYLTDGRNDPSVRRLSIASLRRHCGEDVQVHVLSARGLYEPRCGETLVDVTETWDWVFGRDRDMAKPPCEGCNYPSLLFAKLLPPLIPYFAQFDRVVVLDDDIEVASPDFLPALSAVPLYDDADIALVPDTAAKRCAWVNLIMRDKRTRPLWPAGATYFCMGVVLHRTTWTPGYLDRTRMCLTECARWRFCLPEEMSANLYMRVQGLDEHVSMIPEYPEVDRVGASAEELKTALSIHWAGPRKNAELPKWAARYPEVK